MPCECRLGSGSRTGPGLSRGPATRVLHAHPGASLSGAQQTERGPDPTRTLPRRQRSPTALGGIRPLCPTPLISAWWEFFLMHEKHGLALVLWHFVVETWAGASPFREVSGLTVLGRAPLNRIFRYRVTVLVSSHELETCKNPNRTKTRSKKRS